MAYNTKAIKTDVNGNPISQYYNPETDEYEPVEGAGGGNKVILYNEDGTPNNSLSLQEILDKLDQLKGTVIDEETRKQNEQIRQQNEQQRIDLYNALKDLDVSQYELRLQKLEHDTSVEETMVEEAYGPVIPLPENVVNGQINDIRIEGKTYRNVLEDYFGKRDSWERLDGELIDNDFIKATANGSYKAFFLKSGIITLKSSTQYTIFVEVRKNTLDANGLILTGPYQDDPFGKLNIILPGATGIFKFLVTTKSDLTNTFPLRMFINTPTKSGEIEFRVMLLEGDYTNENISYIRGTKSTVGAIRLKSDVGRNLAPIKDYSHDNQHQTVTKTDETFNGQPVYRAIKKTTATPITDIGSITIRKGETFTASIWIKHEQQPTMNTARLIFYKDAVLKSVFAKNDYGEWERLVVTYTNDTNADMENVYIYFYPANGVGEVTYFTCPKIERGNKATEYNFYKESTLYVLGKDNEGNILELHSLPNGVKDEINVAERRVIKRTKKIIFDGSENWTEFTTAYADSYGFYRITINGWVTQNKAVNRFDTGLAWNDLATFRIVTSIATGGSPNQIGFHSNGNLYLSLPKDYIDANYSPSLNGMKQYLADHPITLIYQLAEPEIIPVEVFGNLQSYENGTVYVETIIPRVDFYTPEGIEFEGPPEKEPRIKEIDSLYLVDRENGLLIPLDISKAIIEDTALRHPDLVGGALVVWDYIPDVESTNPVISMTLPTNLKASINSSLGGIRDLSKKIGNLNIRVTAIQKDDISQLNKKILEVEDNLNRHVDDFDNHIADYNRILEECAIWKRIDTLSAPVQLTTGSTYDNPIIVPVNETPESSNVYAVEFRIQSSDNRASQITIFAGGTSSATGIFCGVDHEGNIYAARRYIDAANRQFKFFALISPTGGTREVYISRIFRVK